MPAPLDLSDLVVQRALSNGGAGERWLAELPELVTALADRWRLELGATFCGGTASCVVAATDANGRDCVLKVAMPVDRDNADCFARSVSAHRLAAGRGCAELYEVDWSTRALLLERLGPDLHELNTPLWRLLDTVATTLRSFWRPFSAGHDLPTAIDQTAWLARSITSTWSELGRPCGREVVDRAVTYCDERAAAFDPSRAVLVHGDAHGWNTLDAGDGAFKFVDPEGLWSEPAHDLGVPMREYNEPLLAGDTQRLVRERAGRLAASCGVDVDVEAVWQWGFIERVSTGLANLRDFDDGSGTAFLEVARRCL